MRYRNANRSRSSSVLWVHIITICYPPGGGGGGGLLGKSQEFETRKVTLNEELKEEK